MSNSSIRLIDGTLSGPEWTWKRWQWRGTLHSPMPSITGPSPSGCLVSYLGYSLVGSYNSAGDTIDVFNSSSRLGNVFFYVKKVPDCWKINISTIRKKIWKIRCVEKFHIPNHRATKMWPSIIRSEPTKLMKPASRCPITSGSFTSSPVEIGSYPRDIMIMFGLMQNS